MKNINLLDKFLVGFHEVFKLLEIDYVSGIKARNNGTVLCLYTQKKRPIVFMHQEVSSLFYAANYKNLDNPEYNCFPGVANYVNLSLCISYDGVGNFRVLNNYVLEQIKSNNKLVNVLLIYSGERVDLLYEVFSLLQHYSRYYDEEFSSLFKEDMIAIEEILQGIRKVALSQYRYVSIAKILHMQSLWKNITAIPFSTHYRLSPIDFTFSEKCTDNNKDKRWGRIYAHSRARDFLVRSPYIELARKEQLAKENKHFLKLGCLYGSMQDYSLVEIDKPYINFKDSNETNLCFNPNSPVDIAELIIKSPYKAYYMEVVRDLLNDDNDKSLLKKNLTDISSPDSTIALPFFLNEQSSNYIDNFMNSGNLTQQTSQESKSEIVSLIITSILMLSFIMGLIYKCCFGKNNKRITRESAANNISSELCDIKLNQYDKVETQRV